MSKTCSTCKVEKDTEEFYTHTKHGFQAACKKCQNSRNGRWHQTQKERNNARSRHNHLVRKYGITSEDYEQMLTNQGGVCWICKRPPKTKRLSVDHNHKTGQVRGLLCYWCNHKLLPTARENPAVLLKAAEYLTHFNSLNHQA